MSLLQRLTRSSSCVLPLTQITLAHIVIDYASPSAAVDSPFVARQAHLFAQVAGPVSPAVTPVE